MYAGVGATGAGERESRTERERESLAALASFTEDLSHRHPNDYLVWKQAVHAAGQTLPTEPAAGESDAAFRARALEQGPGQLQAAMNQVHLTLGRLPCWAAWGEAEQKVAMRNTQRFLLRKLRKAEVEVVGGRACSDVDHRILRVTCALATSLELDSWKFEQRIKDAMDSREPAFAHLYECATPLASLDFRAAEVHDPTYVLEVFQQFASAVIRFLEGLGLEASMDAQIDVALYTITMIAPTSLYYHVKVAEKLLWEPWAAAADTQFTIMLLTSVVIALFSINTSHFDMDARLFMGIMASHDFAPEEFQPRHPRAPLPPPFGPGPPLGDPAALHVDDDGAAAQGAARGSEGAPSSAAGPVATAQGGADGGREGGGPGGAARSRKRQLQRLEKAGAAIVEQQGLSQMAARAYPFLVQEADDLLVKDVRELLEHYRRVVMQYESLKAGLNAEASRM